MPPEIVGVFIMSALGLFFAVILAVSYVFLRVEEDPRLDAVEEMLPGTNCGACGSPGCRAFAESVVGGAAEVGNCTVSAAASLVQIADFLGVDIGGGGYGGFYCFALEP